MSEEHETSKVDLSTVIPPEKYNAEVESIISEDEMVPVSDVTVWVDPLDATQEYTGTFYIVFFFFMCLELQYVLYL